MGKIILCNLRLWSTWIMGHGLFQWALLFQNFYQLHIDVVINLDLVLIFEVQENKIIIIMLFTLQWLSSQYWRVLQISAEVFEGIVTFLSPSLALKFIHGMQPLLVQCFQPTNVYRYRFNIVTEARFNTSVHCHGRLEQAGLHFW